MRLWAFLLSLMKFLLTPAIVTARFADRKYDLEPSRRKMWLGILTAACLILFGFTFTFAMSLDFGWEFRIALGLYLVAAALLQLIHNQSRARQFAENCPPNWRPAVPGPETGGIRR